VQLVGFIIRTATYINWSWSEDTLNDCRDFVVGV